MNQQKVFLRGKRPRDENACQPANVRNGDGLIVISRPAVTTKSLGDVAPKNTQCVLTQIKIYVPLKTQMPRKHSRISVTVQRMMKMMILHASLLIVTVTSLSVYVYMT